MTWPSPCWVLQLHFFSSIFWLALLHLYSRPLCSLNFISAITGSYVLIDPSTFPSTHVWFFQFQLKQHYISWEDVQSLSITILSCFLPSTSQICSCLLSTTLDNKLHEGNTLHTVISMYVVKSFVPFLRLFCGLIKSDLPNSQMTEQSKIKKYGMLEL